MEFITTCIQYQVKWWPWFNVINVVPHSNIIDNKRYGQWPWPPWMGTPVHCAIIVITIIWFMHVRIVMRVRQNGYFCSSEKWIGREKSSLTISKLRELVYHRNAFTNKFIQFKIQSKVHSIPANQIACDMLLTFDWMHHYSSFQLHLSTVLSTLSSVWNVAVWYICTASKDSSILNCTLLSGGNWIL